MSILRTRRSPALLIAILLLHLGALLIMNAASPHRSKSARNSERNSRHIVFLTTTPLTRLPVVEHSKQLKPDQNHKPQLAPPKTSITHIATSDPVVKPIATASVPEKPEPTTPTTITPSAPPLDRNVKELTQQLERELRFEKQKEEAAKPPNQIAREYWDKQNHPYKNKWEALAHKIEKAGVPRDPQIETFKAPDGTQITKIGNRCYKAPDPGRTYLHQAEVREVICTR